MRGGYLCLGERYHSSVPESDIFYKEPDPQKVSLIESET
jgi:hypothetical protein